MIAFPSGTPSDEYSMDDFYADETNGYLDPPRPYSRHAGYTQDDGSIRCVNTTDDDGDTGYVGDYAEWTDKFPDKQSFFKRVGGSRMGIGHDVFVTLDDREYTQEEAEIEAAKPKPTKKGI